MAFNKKHVRALMRAAADAPENVMQQIADMVGQVSDPDDEVRALGVLLTALGYPPSGGGGSAPDEPPAPKSSPGSPPSGEMARASRLPAAERRWLDEKMGMRRSETTARRKGTDLVFAFMTPEEASARRGQLEHASPPTMTEQQRFIASKMGLPVPSRGIERRGTIVTYDIRTPSEAASHRRDLAKKGSRMFQRGILR